jgi:hypothetical protein
MWRGFQGKKIGQPDKIDRNSRLVATIGASLEEFAVDVRAIIDPKIKKLQ